MNTTVFKLSPNAISEIWRKTKFLGSLIEFGTLGAGQALRSRILNEEFQDGSRLTHEYSKKAMKELDFSYQLRLPEGIAMEDLNGSLLCPNHLSYWDVLVISALIEGTFVSSTDIEKTPFLGDLARMGGSLFIERNDRSRVDQDISQLEQALKDQRRVVLFLEGTSTNGSEVLRFKSPLLAAAQKTSSRVFPVTINYHKINESPFGLQNCDLIAWYGEMSFAPHLLKFLTAVKTVDVEVIVGQPIKILPSDDLKSKAEHIREQVVSKFIGHRKIDE
ncbi:MAG: hypothetical protein COT74_11790 [Bdellovibrionales bacterium CG10_big_fil_rev_8_21_14_0_10_45_34]|nr:MAG: hypothetical protein COT74_11790 [Bdellovibrionales bacterium CG10_big_fil_rev_8_21_14_0_10_45_34]